MLLAMVDIKVHYLSSLDIQQLEQKELARDIYRVPAYEAIWKHLGSREHTAAKPSSHADKLRTLERNWCIFYFLLSFFQFYVWVTVMAAERPSKARNSAHQP